MRILEIGSGVRPLRGISIRLSEADEIIRTDIVHAEHLDVVCDAQALPFKDTTFDYIYTAHVLEHVPDYIKALREMWRVGKNGCVVEIRVPHWSGPGAVYDPTHRHLFTIKKFLWLINRDSLNILYAEKLLGPVRFKLIEARLNNIPVECEEDRKSFGLMFRFYAALTNKLFSLLKRFLKLEDAERFAFVMGGFEEIHIRMKVIKGD